MLTKLQVETPVQGIDAQSNDLWCDMKLHARFVAVRDVPSSSSPLAPASLNEVRHGMKSRMKDHSTIRGASACPSGSGWQRLMAVAE